MSSSHLAELTQSQRDRLAFIELRLRFFGEICRQDLIGRFGMQAAAATRDLAQYKELGPHNLSYDPKEKLYVRSETFFPVFDFSAERVLTWLAQGLVTQSQSFGSVLRLFAMAPGCLRISIWNCYPL
ncbi:MAG: hypothetical protein U1F63_10440 [Chitinivorax sp.]